MSPDEIRALRNRLGLTRAAFASRYGLTPRTLEGWENGRSPSDAGTTLLRLIEAEPQLIADLLAKRQVARLRADQPRSYPMHTEHQARYSLALAQWDLKYGLLDAATFQNVKRRIKERYPSLGNAAT